MLTISMPPETKFFESDTTRYTLRTLPTATQVSYTTNKRKSCKLQNICTLRRTLEETVKKPLPKYKSGKGKNCIIFGIQLKHLQIILFSFFFLRSQLRFTYKGLILLDSRRISIEVKIANPLVIIQHIKA